MNAETQRPKEEKKLQRNKPNLFSFLRLYVSAFIFLSSIAQAANTTQPAVDPQLLKTLQAIDAKTADIKDFTADFEQQKFSPLLKKPLVSKGTITARGVGMLWNTVAPEPTRMRIDATSMQIYYVNQKTLEQYPLKGKLAAMAANPLPRLATLMEQFTITSEPVEKDAVDLNLHLLLEPKSDDIKQYVDHVRVRLDQDRGVIRFFELTDPDGERTEISFTNPKTNTGIDGHALDLNVPADAKTVHPLGQ